MALINFLLSLEYERNTHCFKIPFKYNLLPESELFAGPAENTSLGKSEKNGGPLQEKDKAQANSHSETADEAQL